MTMPLSWKVGAAVAGLTVAALDAQLAKARAEQRSMQLAATLQRRRDDLANTYREVGQRAAHYQAEQSRRQALQQQEARRIQASYRLGPNQHCAGGIVINRNASSFTHAVGKSGQPIRCQGDTAAEPLR